MSSYLFLESFMKYILTKKMTKYIIIFYCDKKKKINNNNFLKYIFDFDV